MLLFAYLNDQHGKHRPNSTRTPPQLRWRLTLSEKPKLSKTECLSRPEKNIAVWILAAKLPNSDLNFAVDFLCGFFLCFFPKKNAPKKSTKKSPQNSPRNLVGKIPSDLCRDLLLSVCSILWLIVRFVLADAVAFQQGNTMQARQGPILFSEGLLCLARIQVHGFEGCSPCDFWNRLHQSP